MTCYQSCVHLDDLFMLCLTCLSPVFSWLPVPGDGEKIGMLIHGSMYDSVEIELARKKSVRLFCGLDDEVVRQGKKVKSKVKMSAY